MTASDSNKTRVALVVAGLLLLLAAPFLSGHLSIIALSGDSMHPNMPDGSVALCHAADAWEVQEGDVVAIELRDRLIVHEVIHTETETNMLGEPRERHVTTQGWNNDVQDPEIPARLVDCQVSVWVTPSLEIRSV